MKGAFFPHGRGGPRTEYAYTTSDNWHHGGSKIVVMDHEAVKEWLARRDEDDLLIKLFGEELKEA